MNIKNKQMITTFIHKNKFDLNGYLSYIFQQMNRNIIEDSKGLPILKSK